MRTLRNGEPRTWHIDEYIAYNKVQKIKAPLSSAFIQQKDSKTSVVSYTKFRLFFKKATYKYKDVIRCIAYVLATTQNLEYLVAQCSVA